jgi:hypothetical protein
MLAISSLSPALDAFLQQPHRLVSDLNARQLLASVFMTKITDRRRCRSIPTSRRSVGAADPPASAGDRKKSAEDNRHGPHPT